MEYPVTTGGAICVNRLAFDFGKGGSPSLRSQFKGMRLGIQNAKHWHRDSPMFVPFLIAKHERFHLFRIV